MGGEKKARNGGGETGSDWELRRRRKRNGKVGRGNEEMERENEE